MRPTSPRRPAAREKPSGRPALVLSLTLGLLSACSNSAPLPARAIELNRQGSAAMAQGDLALAEARIALALEYSARFTEAWVNLGLVEMMRGNFVRARRDFVRARDLNPDLPTPHHALGLLADHQLLAPEAELHYRAALKVDPGFAPARINLARRLFERGALEEAREQFLRTTQVAPAYVEGWSGLCETLWRLNRADEGDEVLAVARTRFGDRPAILLLGARALIRRRAFAQAESLLGSIAGPAARDDLPAILAWLAVARLGSGDLAGAENAAKRALALDPDEKVARYAIERGRAASEPLLSQH